MLHTFYLGLLLFVAESYALYDSSSAVVDLTPSNFDKLVTDSDDVWIVEFYAPWCGHCKNLVPEYQKAAKALKGIIKVGAVDADNHQALAKKYGVSGYPTLKIFTGSKHTPYQGQRTAEAFVDAGIKAAKEKAYESLGKKSSGGSGDKRFKSYGHRIPWKKIQRSEKKPEKQTSKPQLKVDKVKIKTLQDILFREGNDEDIKLDTEIKVPKHLKKQMPASKLVLKQKTVPKHTVTQRSSSKHTTQKTLSKHSIRLAPKYSMRQKATLRHSIVHKNVPSHLLTQKTVPKKQKMVHKEVVKQKMLPNHSIGRKTIPKHLLRQRTASKNSMTHKSVAKNFMRQKSHELDKLQAALFRKKVDDDIDLNGQK
ncbi:protein disulfide-isomerase A6 homolog CaBP1 isoform X2 [Choristoneura fumiferana]|uniref:protein disulfide-isomerase A6 homolog CaBP1 isoform X2 n=1 Tax=Choristoneura fumiferana TaxID=7141 RepID=UPI003D159B05